MSEPAFKLHSYQLTVGDLRLDTPVFQSTGILMAQMAERMEDLIRPRYGPPDPPLHGPKMPSWGEHYDWLAARLDDTEQAVLAHLTEETW